MFNDAQTNRDPDQLIENFIRISQLKHAEFQQKLEQAAIEAMQQPDKPPPKPMSRPRKLAVSWLLAAKTSSNWLLDKTINLVDFESDDGDMIDGPMVIDLVVEEETFADHP